MRGRGKTFDLEHEHEPSERAKRVAAATAKRDRRDNGDDDEPTEGAEPSRHQLRDLLTDAAIAAEKETGKREKTDEEARHSLIGRIARLVAGWVLVLLGLAGLVLPGPGWLIVLAGLALLPYKWTDNLIRVIRRKIPGIPEDGRIPTRTWVIMGAAVVATTSASLWWGLRDKGEDDAPEKKAATSTTTTIATPAGPRAGEILSVSTAGSLQRQLTQLYGAVTAELSDNTTRHIVTDDPCDELLAHAAQVALLTPENAIDCLPGDTEEAVREQAAGADLKVYGPVTVDEITYWPVVATTRIAVDDEPAELAIDGVSEEITDGGNFTGQPATAATALLKAAGVTK